MKKDSNDNRRRFRLLYGVCMVTALTTCVVSVYCVSSKSTINWILTARSSRSPSLLYGIAKRSSQVSLNGTKLGFIMAMNFSDQLTGSIWNLVSLKCFVGKHIGSDVKVVEPFIHPIGSILGVSLSPSYNTRWFHRSPEDLNKVKLSDLIDINELERYIISQKYASFVSWETFMKNLPRKLILVYHTWCTEPNCTCGQEMIETTKEFVVENKLEVVRRVCLNFRQRGVLSPQEVLSILYGPFNPNEVVVVLNIWGGIYSEVMDWRYSISQTSCLRRKVHFQHHSKQILSDAKEYSKKFMNETKQYVAVMVRLEYYFIYHNLKNQSLEFVNNQVNKCFLEINQIVQKIKRDRKINQTLLTMDIGKYGSRIFYIENYKIDKTLRGFFKMLFGNLLRQEAWENSFESVAKYNEPGYIAMLQQELAAGSVCLVHAGGGTFQEYTADLHKDRHSRPCIYKLCK